MEHVARRVIQLEHIWKQAGPRGVGEAGMNGVGRVEVKAKKAVAVENDNNYKKNHNSKSMGSRLLIRIVVVTVLIIRMILIAWLVMTILKVIIRGGGRPRRRIPMT